ncbi:transposase, partial [Shigella flexneri]
TLKSPSYTKSVSWQHYRIIRKIISANIFQDTPVAKYLF